MALDAESLRKAVGGEVIAIEHGEGVVGLCKSVADPREDRFNRIVSGQMVAGPVVFARVNADGTYSSLTPEDVQTLKERFGAPLREIRSTDKGMEKPVQSIRTAIRQDNDRVVDAMLADGAVQPNQSMYGQTALHLAVDSGAEKCAGVLLKYGAYVDSIDRRGQTPLYHAVERGDEKMTGLLLKAGADPEISDGKMRVLDLPTSPVIKIALSRSVVAGKNGTRGQNMEQILGRGRK